MALTHIDCWHFRGTRASGERSSFVSLNPSGRAGSLVIAAAQAGRENLGGQVACRMALENFVDAVLEGFEVDKREPAQDQVAARSQAILEQAFRRANRAVYEFGHKLAAGGRMAASLLGVIIDGGVAAAGRVGEGSVYLARNSESAALFEPRTDGRISYVGENSVLSVELAAIKLSAEDRLLALPSILDSHEEARIERNLADAPLSSNLELLDMLEISLGVLDELPFGIAAVLGPEAIYLKRVVHSG